MSDAKSPAPSQPAPEARVDLEALEKLLAEATPGEWRVMAHLRAITTNAPVSHDLLMDRPPGECAPNWHNDAALACALRNAAPELILLARRSAPTPGYREGWEALKEARAAIDRDRTGLAGGLAKIQRIVGGYRWLGAGEWGSYSWEERTEQTLRTEIATCLDQINVAAGVALNESGKLADKTVRAIDAALACALPPPESALLTKAARCSVCGAQRIVQDDGTPGACGFLNCRDPMADYRHEHSAAPAPVETRLTEEES